MTTKVFYHANCYDGFGAAFMAWKYYQGLKKKTKVEYIPCFYSDPVPNVKVGDSVFVVDFSFKREVLENWAATPNLSLVVLDHHKSVQADIADLPYVTFDLKHSGAMLAYNHFFRNGGEDLKLEQLAAYLEDRDLWKFSLEETRQFHAGLCSYPMDFGVWDDLDIDKVIMEGGPLLRYQETLTKSLADQVNFVEIGGYMVPMVNISLLFSEVPTELLKRHPEALFAAYRYERKDGFVQYGLRSRSEFDVSAIAKQYGGGGHQQAAGFEIKKEVHNHLGQLTHEVIQSKVWTGVNE